MAASIAYFSFFSLFPLLLGVFAAGSFFVESTALQERLAAFLQGTLPGSAAFVRDNVEAVVRLRGAAGIVSVAGLWWSASKVFGALTRGINGALGLGPPDASFLSPLRYLLMAIVVASLMLLVAAVSTALTVLPQLNLSPVGVGLNTLTTLAGSIASYVFVVAMLALIYKLVPHTTPSWTHVAPGALSAALLIEVGKLVYVFYVENVAELEAIYGSVSSVIVLLLWLYFVARVLLFGSQVIAVCQEQRAE